VTVTLGVAIAACTVTYAGMASVAEGTATTPKKLVVSTSLPIPTMDGIMSNSVESMHQVFDSLTLIAADGKVVPGLATKWRSNPTGTKWTFTIRKNVKFHNGKPLTPQDVVWSYNKVVLDSPLLRSSVVPFVQTVYVQNGEVVFRMKAKNGLWPRQASLIYIAPEKSYNPTTFASKPIGTGPFQVVSFDANRRLVLKANPQYWGGKPAFDQVTEEVISDETARLNALRSGAVDVAALSPATVKSAQADKKLTTKVFPGNLVTYVGFNTNHAVLAKVAFRRAVDRAIDRAAIAKSLYQGLAVPTGQLIAPVTFGYSKTEPALKPSIYNPTLAKQFLQQAGYNGEQIDLQYPNGPNVPSAPLYAQAVQGYLQAVGINVRLREQDQTTFLQDWLGRRFTGMFLWSFQPSQLDAGQVYNLMLNAANYFTDPVTTGLFRLQDGEPNEAKRLAFIEELGKSIKQNMYFSPLHQYMRIYSWRKSKVTAVPRPDGYIYPQYYKLP
jgi:peptide/nickel transport system substrate-binding protein